MIAGMPLLGGYAEFRVQWGTYLCSVMAVSQREDRATAGGNHWKWCKGYTRSVTFGDSLKPYKAPLS